MKTTLLLFCLLLTTAAFAQLGGTIGNQVQAYQFESHPEHATYAPMAQERSVLGGSSYASAQGERPLSEFPQPAPVSLGTVARELKQQHAQLKKSRVVWVNQ
jgi:hypothetical protein